jgi:DNA-binding NtrC family response regulator
VTTTNAEGAGTRTVVQSGRIVGKRARVFRLRSGREAKEFASSARIGSRAGNDLVLAHETVSRLHCEITADEHGFRLRDLGSTNGTFVDGVRVRDLYLRSGAVIAVGEIAVSFELTGAEREIAISASDSFGDAVGTSAPMRELFASLERAARSEATILIEGESGTGKELLARAVHRASARSGGPLVVVDCGAMPANLLESLLFGHERGAFTGAVDRRIGQLEDAAGGTVFLDELGEIPLDLQPKLLRAIENREIRRVGGREPIALDVRFVAATNRDLAAEVNRGAFREDLYYRIAVVRATVPPLRDRRDDVRPLVREIVRRAAGPERADALLAGISADNWAKLESHPWPGNVRELRNVIERSLALGESVSVAPAARGVASSSSSSGEVDLDRAYGDQKDRWLDRFDRAYILAQLERYGGNISQAARASGLERMHFKRILKRLTE